MSYSHVGTFRYFDADGSQRDDMRWWDKAVDRMKGRIEDLLEPGTDGLKDHFMAHYMACLEKSISA